VPQIEAIRRGLTQVVPQAAFELFTWQEVEKRICGDAEITIAALRQNSETVMLLTYHSHTSWLDCCVAVNNTSRSCDNNNNNF